MELPTWSTLRLKEQLSILEVFEYMDFSSWAGAGQEIRVGFITGVVRF